MAEEYKFETRCIHGNGGLVEGHPYGAVSVPIFQTATFAHPGIGRSTGYDYTRESNPTRHELESVMSTLEEADDSIACTSGMDYAWNYLKKDLISSAQKTCMAER